MDDFHHSAYPDSAFHEKGGARRLHRGLKDLLSSMPAITDNEQIPPAPLLPRAEMPTSLSPAAVP